MAPQDPSNRALSALVARSPPEVVDLHGRFIAWLRLWLPWGQSLAVRWTHNRSTVVSVRYVDGGLALRLHDGFAAAGPQVAQALAAFVVGAPRGQHAALRAFIHRLQPPRAPRRQELRPQGAAHDLMALAAAVNAAHFAGQCTAVITWGRAAAPSARRRSIVLGSYHQGHNLIRLHPALDRSFVPAYVVCGVIFHEMLHEAIGFGEASGRRQLHPPAFVARERAYPDYARCRAWEEANIGRLLAVRR